MKTTKKFFALLLSFALVLSMFTANAQVSAETTTQTDTITVTLRVEDSNRTLIPLTQVTLTQADVEKVNQTFTVESGSTETPLLPEKATAAHVIAKYMTDTSETPTDDLIFNTSYYDGSHNVAHIKGEEKTDSDSSWSYRVNNTYPVEGSMSSYEVQNGDNIVLFYSDCYDETAGEYGAYTNYSYFDKESYETTVNESVTVSLSKEDGYDEYYNTLIGPASAETVSVENNGAVVSTAVTNESGSVELLFDQAGTYTIHSNRVTDTGLAVNSRAFATITVKDNTPEITATPVPSSAPASSATPSATPAQPTLTPSNKQLTTAAPTKASVKKPAAPKRLKAKTKAKKVTLSWKKVKNAKGYVVAVSKKNKKNFKTFATTKKNKITKKFKKGTYFIKVRSYKKANGKRVYSKYSKTIQIKVK